MREEKDYGQFGGFPNSFVELVGREFIEHVGFVDIRRYEELGKDGNANIPNFDEVVKVLADRRMSWFVLPAPFTSNERTVVVDYYKETRMCTTPQHLPGITVGIMQCAVHLMKEQKKRDEDQEFFDEVFVRRLRGHE